MVEEVVGELQYHITDGIYRPKVSINDIKAFKIPNTDHWRMNDKQFLRSCFGKPHIIIQRIEAY